MLSVRSNSRTAPVPWNLLRKSLRLIGGLASPTDATSNRLVGWLREMDALRLAFAA